MKGLLIPLLVLSFAIGCVPEQPPITPATTRTTTTTTTTTTVPPSAGSTTIMGASRYGAADLVAFYQTKGRTPATTAEGPVGGFEDHQTSACATMPDLAALFIEEGAAEGVRGDLAFVQAMLETGWLGHSTRVPASYCNYAGIGAVDAGSGANDFGDARTGVRAQIQHLRRYADPSATCSNFAHPNVDPRCHLVLPAGRAATWEQMGNGNWATDPEYSDKILRLYRELAAAGG